MFLLAANDDDNIYERGQHRKFHYLAHLKFDHVNAWSVSLILTSLLSDD
jgi:hypothetical protein